MKPILAVSHAGETQVVRDLDRGVKIKNLAKLGGFQSVCLEGGNVALFRLAVAGAYRHHQPSFAANSTRICQRKILTRYEISALCPATVGFASRSACC